MRAVQRGGTWRAQVSCLDVSEFQAHVVAGGYERLAVLDGREAHDGHVALHRVEAASVEAANHLHPAKLAVIAYTSENSGRAHGLRR